MHYRQLSPPRLWRILCLGAALSALCGCQSFSYQSLLKNKQLSSEIQQSAPFKHRIFRAAPHPVINEKTLHIYIEGDGRPWRGRIFVAHDPTPEYALMLDAMLKDPSPSLYLGRPCYYHVEDSNCSPMRWTMSRYGEETVNSMTSLIEALAQDYSSVWLIGHSGGGALAILIGRRLNRPVNVLTLAANVNHDAWTQQHFYTPLNDSLDVVSDARRNEEMKEMHWYGKQDENVLPIWIQSYCKSNQVSCLGIEATHASGWLSQWPKILQSAAAFFSGP